MNKNLFTSIIATIIFILVILFPGNLTADLVTIIIIIYPPILFYSIRDLEAKWLWIITSIFIVLSTKLNITNPATQVILTMFVLAGIFFSVRRSFFAKKNI